MSKKTYSGRTRPDRFILLGIVGMFQPIGVDLYRYGLLLLFSTLSFIIFSLSPKAKRQKQRGRSDHPHRDHRALDTKAVEFAFCATRSRARRGHAGR